MKKTTIKKAIVLAIVAAITVNCKAQNVSAGSTEINKQQQPALVAVYDFSAEAVEKVLKTELEKSGGKGKVSKGVIQYKGMRMANISPDIIDVYVKVERKSKKEKDKSTVYMLISKGYDNFIDGGSDAQTFEHAKTYLTELRSKIAADDVDKQIAMQEEVVKKAVKRNNELLEAIQDLEKRKRKTEEEIADKNKALENQKMEVGKEQTVLDALKAKKG